MKTRLLFLASVLAGALTLTGCVSGGPQPSSGSSGTAAGSGSAFTPFYPDTNRISANCGVISNAVAATAPVNPYAGVMQALLGLGVGVLTAGSAAYANIKNKNNQLQTMASGVVTAGPDAVSKVLSVASSTPHFSAVANHINDATP